MENNVHGCLLFSVRNRRVSNVWNKIKICGVIIFMMKI